MRKGTIGLALAEGSYTLMFSYVGYKNPIRSTSNLSGT